MMLFQAFGDRRSDGHTKFPAALLMITCTNQDTRRCDVILRQGKWEGLVTHIRKSRQTLDLVDAARNGLRVSDVTLDGVDLEQWRDEFRLV